MAQLAPPMKAPPARVPARAAPRQQVQAKLDVGPADDHFEREADRTAANVMSGGSAPVSIPPTITPIGAQRKAAAPKKEEEKKKSAPAKTAQRKAAGPAPKKEEEKKPSAGKSKVAQRDAVAGAEGGTASDSVDSAIQSMRSGPAPGLDGATRNFMEGRFGRDFGDVRVHHDTKAAKAAQAIGAKAFTTGNDIFFNAGQYQPNSGTGRSLIAHELTHTVQQKGANGTAARKRIQRAPNPPPPNPAPVTTPTTPATPAAPGTVAPVPTPTEFDVPTFAGAKISTVPVGNAPGTITLPKLLLPEIAGALKGVAGGKNTVSADASKSRTVPTGTNFQVNAPRPKRYATVASQIWTRDARASALKTGTKKKLDDIKAATPDATPVAAGTDSVYYLVFKGSSVRQGEYIFDGTFDQLADSDAFLRPQWSPGGNPLTSRSERLDADHVLEAQLGGADEGLNMWLIDAGWNRSVGPTIERAITGDLKKVIDNSKTLPLPKPLAQPDVDLNWNVVFTKLEKGKFRDTANYWTRDDITNGKHLDLLRIMNADDLSAAGIKLKPGQRLTQIRVFPDESGGRGAIFPLGANNAVSIPGFFYNGVEALSATYLGAGDCSATGGDLMTIQVRIFKNARGKKLIQELTGPITVKRSARLGLNGYVSKDSIYQTAGTAVFTPLSPLTFSDMAISPEGDLVGTGNVLSSKAVFPQLNAALMVRGNRIMMDVPIPSANFSLGPFRVTGTTLSLGVGEDGFFVEGAAAFELGNLGNGSIVAELSENPKLSGNFNLAMDFLNPASVSVTYDVNSDTLSAQATLGVQQGKIPGLDSGQVTIGISREAVSVAGTLNLGGPLRGTVVNVTYNQTDGLKIGADNIPLPLANIPAIQNASLSISATRAADGSGWSFAGTGQATLAVPGATGTITISYLDGAITFSANAQLAKGPATGNLSFTATNRAIDEEGRPVEGPPTDGVNVWGKGSVTIQFGGILTGTAGVELTPDNRVIISGSIGLPPVFEVFPRQDYNKDLFTLSPPEFPIWGVSVAGIGVGIFAFVDARVFFNAYVGPGEIRNAQIGAVMDLDHPEDATVTGHAEFHVPAYAGLGLDVGGGLRARITAAYAEGRVGLTGELGVQADASAAIDIAWSRATGLDLRASVSAQAQPKFRLSANASVTIGVDLLVTDISHTFGPWTKELGSFGPNMTLGVTMPVHWSEAGGLDLSLDNIQIQKPDLDASALMSSVFDQLAG